MVSGWTLHILLSDFALFGLNWFSFSTTRSKHFIPDSQQSDIASLRLL